MLFYWILFMIPAMAAMAAHPNIKKDEYGNRKLSVDPVWVFVWLVLAAISGLRYEVGGDWYTYIYHLNVDAARTWNEVFSRTEWGHWITIKIVNDMGWNVIALNLFYGVIFSGGLVLFLRTQPRPWLSLAAAIPYLFIVVGMGYSRQAVALGLVMIGIISLKQERVIFFIFWTLIATTFHNSAILMLTIAGLTSQRNKFKVLALLLLIMFLSYEFLLAKQFTRMIHIYVERDITSSDGALIRLSMNLIAGITFLSTRKRLDMLPQEKRLWSIISLCIILMWFAYFLTGLSTALDRMALYFIPLQIVIASHLPDIFGSRGRKNNGGVFTVLFYFAIVQFIWLNFAGHAPYWLPYQMSISH